MRTLSTTEITKLATRKGAKTIAVENFLSTMEGQNEWQLFANLAQDAKSYKWNQTTVDQISKGIRLAFKE